MAITVRTKIVVALAVVAVAVVAGIAWWQRAGDSDTGPAVTAHRWERVIVLDRFDGTTWKPAYEVKNAGTGVDTMAWPTDVPPADTATTVGAMRPGNRIELLYLDLGTLGSCRVAAEVWRKYADGDTVPAAVRGKDGKLACRAL